MGRRKVDPNDAAPRLRPSLSPDLREKQMIGYAVDLAEKQLREGTASSQVITHYLKLATSKEKLEQEKLELEKELLVAKTEALQSSKRIEELYTNAIKSMQIYSGRISEDED